MLRVRAEGELYRLDNASSPRCRDVSGSNDLVRRRRHAESRALIRIRPRVHRQHVNRGGATYRDRRSR